MRARKPLNRPTRPGCWLPLAARLSAWACSASKLTSPVASTISLKPPALPRPAHRRRPEDEHAGLRDLALQALAELAAMASPLSAGSRRSWNGLRMMNMEP